MSEGATPSAPPTPGAPPATAAARPRLWTRLEQGIAPRPFGFFAALGEHLLLLGRAMAWLFRRPFRLRLFLEQMEFIGVGSLPIILLVGLAGGAVATQQAISALAIFQQERFTGATVGISLARELAPLLSALMLTARAGSGMATELGSMRITEQIDALTTFAVNPVQYLVTPRIVASVIMLPVLTMVFNLAGLLATYLVACHVYNLNFGSIAALFQYWVDPRDYVRGIIKAAVFGLSVALSACFYGFNVRGGAKEVGLATTRAVVVASVSVVVLDYFVNEALNLFWPPVE